MVMVRRLLRGKLITIGHDQIWFKGIIRLLKHGGDIYKGLVYAMTNFAETEASAPTACSYPSPNIKTGSLGTAVSILALISLLSSWKTHT